MADSPSKRARERRKREKNREKKNRRAEPEPEISEEEAAARWFRDPGDEPEGETTEGDEKKEESSSS